MRLISQNLWNPSSGFAAGFGGLCEELRTQIPQLRVHQRLRGECFGPDDPA